MKKLILVFVAIAITAGVYAQADSTNRKTSPRDMNSPKNQNLQNNTQDLDKNKNQNLQNNSQDLKNTQNQNSQDLNKNQNQKMQDNPQDLNMNHQNMQHNSMDKSHSDGIMMKEGKLMKVKDGKTSVFEDNEMTLSNGTKIMRDGTCIKKDGTKITLKEGQHMDMSGNLISNKSDKDKNMYLVPDSTRKKNY